MPQSFQRRETLRFWIRSLLYFDMVLTLPSLTALRRGSGEVGFIPRFSVHL